MHACICMSAFKRLHEHAIHIAITIAICMHLAFYMRAICIAIAKVNQVIAIRSLSYIQVYGCMGYKNNLIKIIHVM